MTPVKDFVRRLSLRKGKKSKSNKNTNGDAQTFAELQQSSDSQQRAPSAANDVRPSPTLHFPPPPAEPPNEQEMKFVDSQWTFETIRLLKQGRGLGFTVAGGAGKDDAINSDDANFYVTKIIDGGVAAVDGRLRVGDIIESVNGISYTGLTHRQAIDVLRQSPEEVSLVVKRPVATTIETVVEIDLLKGDKGLGFTVGGGIDDQVFTNDNGIFVTKIVDGGAAHIDGRLAIGDRIIAVNNVELCDVTHNKAVSTLKAVSGSVHLVVGKITLMPQVNNKTGSDDLKHRPNGHIRESIRRAFSGPNESPYTTSMPTVDDTPLQDDAASTRARRSSAGSRRSATGRRARATSVPELVPRIMTEKDIASFVKEPREIELRRRRHQGLGFNIVGGKEGHGIFISSIVAGSIADLNGELRRGDQLLNVNGVNLRDASHEEAVEALRTSGEVTRITVQYRPEEFGHFERIVRELHQKTQSPLDNAASRPPPVRTLFVRALFDYDPSRDRTPSSSKALKFSFGDILHVVIPPASATAAAVDWWQARRVVPWSDPEHSAGLVPSKSRIDALEIEKQKSVATVTNLEEEQKEMEHTTRKGRGFPLSRTLSFTKKEKLTRSNFCYELATSLSYEPVVQLQVRYPQPVVIIGPLKGSIYDQLMTEFPDDYRSCVPHTSRPKRFGEFDGTDYHFVTSREQMEYDINRVGSPYIEAGIYNGHLYGITANSVRDVGKQGKRCLLDVSSDAIVRLQAAGIYPIAMLIRPASPTVMSGASWDKPVSEDESKRVFALTTKILFDYGKYFTAIINAENPLQVYERVKEIIDEQSQPTTWIASKDRL